MGKHLIKGWSKTQTLSALSSGESELYATLKAASEGLGLLSIAADLGIQLAGKVWADASAVLGIIKRKGLGKTRHIDIGLLWIQQTAAENRLKFGKVLGKDNPADLYTKYLDAETIHRHCRTIAAECTEGRAESAPELQNMLNLQSTAEWLAKRSQVEMEANVLGILSSGGGATVRRRRTVKGG